MPAAKQAALEAIARLPDDTDMDEIMYRLYALDKIRKGREAAERCLFSGWHGSRIVRGVSAHREQRGARGERSVP